MNIAIIGSGYVGLVAGACFADTGNDVICVDNDPEKIDALQNGRIPIYEPGLTDIVERNVKAERLKFTTSLPDAVKASEIIFIAVGTPQDEDGSADLTHVIDVAKGIGRAMNGPKIVVDKSTVPVGTGKLVKDTIQALTPHPVEVVSNPEFLKEGAAIDDFMKPDRVVIGASSEYAAEVMKDLYAPFVRTNRPILVMDVPSAEMTKYAANSMLAARVSFMNEIATLCERVGADINHVRIGIGTDSRIGMSFLFPGIGYGGSCFPKDVQALIRTGKNYSVDLQICEATEQVNAAQKLSVVKKIMKHFGSEDLSGKKFAVWGLAFKPQTDDTREAPALVVIRELVKMNASVAAHDPEAVATFQERLGPDKLVSYAENYYDTLDGADALILCTEWNVYRKPNFPRMKDRMKGAVIFDGRNILSQREVREHGFCYYSVGRPPIGV